MILITYARFSATPATYVFVQWETSKCALLTGKDLGCYRRKTKTLMHQLNLPSKQTTSQQRRYNVAATS